MSEPIRKKNKLNAVLAVTKAPQPLLSKPVGSTYLQFTSSHESEPGTFDIEEFALGYKSPRGEKYTFTGRPKLAEELAPFLIKNLAASPNLTLGTVRQSLRTYFRLFDSIENLTEVKSVADLDDTHGALQVRWKVDSATTNCFLQYANEARRSMGLPPLFWPRYERPTGPKDDHDEKHIRAVYFEILHQVKITIGRWERSDFLAGQGKSLVGNTEQSVAFGEPDLHTTYRALIESVGDPCPTREDFFAATGILLTSPEFAKVVYGMYPSMEDVQGFFHLFLIRTGWNVSTAIDIDSAELENCICPHPIASDTHEIVHSVKERANSTQIAISLKRSTTAASNILRTLFHRTALIRNSIRYKEEMADMSTVELAALRRKCRSAWLSVNRTDFTSVMHLEKRTFMRTGTGRDSYLKNVIAKVNYNLPPSEHLPNITARDFRDAFVNFSYSASGFNWLVAMLAAGHKSLESLKSYLRRRRWANHSRGQVGTLLKHFWSEIIERQSVDPALLKVLVSRGEVAETQRLRWMDYKDRTRIGTGCSNFTSPPKYIAPNHTEGEGCRIQRCTLCIHAVIFPDSISLLCRRLEELIYLRLAIPMISWEQSTFPIEFEATTLTLERNFAAKAVNECREYWRAEIANGRHKVQQFEGTYGTRT